MPKMRGFKAELWTDEKFVDLEPLARLMFMGMWTYACDNGHLDDKPKQIKMRVLPTDDVDPVALIDQMVDLGMVVRKDGLLTVSKLREHQRIDDRYFMWCNYCSSSDIPEKSRERHAAATTGTRGDTRAPVEPTRAPTMKEGRKEGEGEGELKAAANAEPRKRATQLPDTFAPNEGHTTFAAENHLDLAHELANFTDHHRAKGSTMKDWDASFRTWLRNAVKWRKDTPRPASLRVLPHASQIEQPPDGLTEAEYSAWMREQRRA